MEIIHSQSVKQSDREILRGLMTIPGVGKKIAHDLMDLGINSVSDLAGRDPQELFDALSQLTGTKVDRCMLYAFRCAVYYASTEEHDPALLKWCNWKDDRRTSRRGGT